MSRTRQSHWSSMPHACTLMMRAWAGMAPRAEAHDATARPAQSCCTQRVSMQAVQAEHAWQHVSHAGQATHLGAPSNVLERYEVAMKQVLCQRHHAKGAAVQVPDLRGCSRKDASGWQLLGGAVARLTASTHRLVCSGDGPSAPFWCSEGAEAQKVRYRDILAALQVGGWRWPTEAAAKIVRHKAGPGKAGETATVGGGGTMCRAAGGRPPPRQLPPSDMGVTSHLLEPRRSLGERRALLGAHTLRHWRRARPLQVAVSSSSQGWVPCCPAGPQLSSSGVALPPLRRGLAAG